MLGTGALGYPPSLMDEEEDEQAAGHPDGEADHVEEGVPLLAAQAAEGDAEVQLTTDNERSRPLNDPRRSKTRATRAGWCMDVPRP